MLEFLTLKPAAFGMDVSDLSLKIIKLEKKGKFLDLASFGETKIQPGIIQKGEIQNERALIKIIKKSLTEVKGEKLKTKYVIASLPEERAFLQVIKLPLMKEEEVKKAVYFEAENYIPLAIKDVYLDSQIVPKIHNHQNRLDVLIAALPQKTVNPYINVLKGAGLKPLALEIESQAISQALVKGKVSPEPLLLIDLGATRTSFIIFFGHSLRFTSSYPISSQQFTEAISKKLKIDLGQAETLKIKQGIKGAKKSDKISRALNPNLTDLVVQIEKHLSYCQDHYGQKVQNILLCGGGANLRGLIDFLSLQLKMPIEFGNPWINILSRPLKELPALPHQESLRYTTALGLALRGAKS